MSLTKIGSIGINTGIQFAGITTVSTLKVGSGVTLSSDGDIFATGVTTATSFVGDGSQLTGVASTENIRTNTNATFLQNINVSGSTTTGSLVSSGAISGTTGTFSGQMQSASAVVTGGITATGGNIVMNDSTGSSANRIKLGTSQDLSIYHDGSNSYISNGTNNLIIKDTTGDDTKGVYIQSSLISFQDETTNEQIAKFTGDGAVELYYDNSKKIETKSDGVLVTGEIQASTLDINGSSHLDGTAVVTGNLDMPDGAKVLIGTGDDLEIYYDGTDGFINQKNNALKFQYNGTTKFFVGSGYLSFQDDYRIGLGNSQDLEIFHNGTNAQVDNSTGNLEIRNKGTFSGTRSIFIRAKVDESSITCNSDGAVELYHNNTKMCETSASGLAFPSGKGIDFNATSDSAGATSEILDDYEEGIWTPTINAGITISNVNSTYVKIGRSVTAKFYVNIPGSFGATAGTSTDLEIGGLPYTSASNGYHTGVIDVGNGGKVGAFLRTQTSASNMVVLVSSGSKGTARDHLNGDTIGGGDYIIGSITYQTD